MFDAYKLQWVTKVVEALGNFNNSIITIFSVAQKQLKQVLQIENLTLLLGAQ